MFSDFNERKEKEEKYNSEGRLPPGQSLTLKFPVLHYGQVPSVDLESWKFRIWGEVKKEAAFTWNEFQNLPKTQIVMDIHCVTRWSKFDTVWEGVSLRTLIDEGILKLTENARFVMQHAAYGFTANLPIEVTLSDNFLLATHYNGEPLTPEHGYPLRGIVGNIPGRDDIKVPYFWKGAKWLQGLEFMVEDKPGFWEQAGYNNNADVWKEERFA